MAKTADDETTSTPATPMEVSAEDLNQSSPDSPMATAMAENTTALPAVATERSTACSGDRPRASSSRNRLTRKSE